METCKMMKNLYDDQCMSHTHCYEWFKRFKDGRQSTRDEPHLGRPSTSCDDAHVVQVRETVRSNRCLTVQEIAEECNISIGSCHDIITTKLEMYFVVSEFVP
jgi:transposase